MKNFKQNTLFLALVTAMASCSLLGPKYTKPVVNTPNNFRSESGISTLKIESMSMESLAWWKKFDDPLLNQLVDAGLKNNNDIQVAIGNIVAAKYELEKSKDLWLPTIGLGGSGLVGQSFSQTFTSNNPAIAGGQSTTNFSGAFGGFVPTYSLNILQNIKATEISQLNLAMQQTIKNSVRLSVISQITGSYFTLLALQRQLYLQEQMLNGAYELKRFEEVKAKNGISSNLNLRAIDQFIAELLAAMPNIRYNITRTENAIRLLTNQNPGRLAVKNNFKNVNLDGLIPANVPSEVLKLRPDVQTAEYQLQISNAKIGLNMAKFFPTITEDKPKTKVE